jgi:uncharacterized protein (TIGR02722 family)
MMALCLCCAAVFAGCASTQVKRVDAGSELDLSGRWNDSDVRLVCDSLIRDCLAAPGVGRAIDQYTAAHASLPPAVIVGNFRNTTSEHLDTGIIATMMETAIINSGKLEFVAGAELREELRGEKYDQSSGNVSDESAAAIGHETGAAFMLNGTVQAIVDQSGNTMSRSYFVTAMLSNIETNRIIWQGQNNEIKKVIRQPKFKP